MNDGPAVPEDTIHDGRRRKGERRRRLLIEATMRVIERGGASAVTQREVANEADLPPSAVMYYFPTIDKLLLAALSACNDEYVQLLTGFDDDDAVALEQMAALIADSPGDGRAHVAAEYELYLMAARRPEMRTELTRWTRAVDRFMTRYVDDAVRRTGATAAVDGLFLRCFCTDDPPTGGEILAILRELTNRT